LSQPVDGERVVATQKHQASTNTIPREATGSARRIVVAMSGGVDSSLVAALLKQQGHDVIGITLQLYDHVVELQRNADDVITSFAESYIAGETPIPCVTCNQQIKFNDLLSTAMDLGAGELATGHYIQKLETASGPALHRARDSDRDQSYFLYATTRAQLENLLFPLGGMTKAEVRTLARTLDLPVADKSDSQDICFVPKGRYSDVIERLKPGAMKGGAIVHVDGRQLGEHKGIINYTVGQRKGIGIPSAEPLFVVRLDADRNEVVVGPREFLRTASLILKNVNWLGDQPVEDACAGNTELFVRVRSSQPVHPAVLTKTADGAIEVLLGDGQEGIAAGQACVFYADDTPQARVLGGGTIWRAVKAREHESYGVRTGQPENAIAAGNSGSR
jgi:tRNA-uridine 2-sulfurtransferase